MNKILSLVTLVLMMVQSLTLPLFFIHVILSICTLVTILLSIMERLGKINLREVALFEY
ncbi:uncharacterized protein METZ01_LOCUS64511 [marine metagenome]|uniref:Uncharacterized protein n=1 Tax=marine metagenome TaxID=408172 RepID=A0A381TAF4_9ZZZZ